MYNITFLLVCLACVGRARRVQSGMDQLHTSPLASKQQSMGQARSKSKRNPSKPLLMLLLSLNPADAQDPPDVDSTGVPSMNTSEEHIPTPQESVSASQNTESPAIEMKKRVFQMRYNSFGLEHPSTVAALNDYAVALGELGRYEEAEPLNKEVLEITWKMYGPEHPDTAVALTNYVDTLNSMGLEADAEALMQQAFELSGGILGSAPEVVDMLAEFRERPIETLREAPFATVGTLVQAVAGAWVALRSFVICFELVGPVSELLRAIWMAVWSPLGAALGLLRARSLAD